MERSTKRTILQRLQTEPNVKQDEVMLRMTQ
jgi:hypothetical protein